MFCIYSHDTKEKLFIQSFLYFKRQQAADSNCSREQFKAYRNKLTSRLERAIFSYKHLFFSVIEQRPDLIWKAVNEVINHHKQVNNLSELRVNDISLHV